MNKEEIEKAKDDLKNLYEMLNPKPTISTNAIKTILKYIQELEFSIEAKEMEHKYDVNMIDEVKREAVKLYKEIRKQNKIIDAMAEQLAGIAIWNNEKEEPLILGDKEEVKQYFEKKVEENDVKN